MIIDFHTHAFPDKIAEKTMGTLTETAGIPVYADGTFGDLQAKLRESGVDLAVVLNIATKPSQMNTINNFAAQTDRHLSGNAASPFIAFGSVHPDAPDCLSELERIKALGLKGVKFHPDYQGFLIDDRKLYPLYETIAALGLIAVFHAGFDPYSPELIHAPPERSARVCRDFPGMTVVLAHLGGFAQFDDVERYLAGRFENLYVDTAMAFSNITTNHLTGLIDRFSADRVLFGSDNPWHKSSYELALIRALDLCPEDRDKILGGNAAKLLGLGASL